MQAIQGLGRHRGVAITKHALERAKRLLGSMKKRHTREGRNDTAGRSRPRLLCRACQRLATPLPRKGDAKPREKCGSHRLFDNKRVARIVPGIQKYLEVYHTIRVRGMLKYTYNIRCLPHLSICLARSLSVSSADDRAKGRGDGGAVRVSPQRDRDHETA